MLDPGQSRCRPTENSVRTDPAEHGIPATAHSVVLICSVHTLYVSSHSDAPHSGQLGCRHGKITACLTDGRPGFAVDLGISLERIAWVHAGSAPPHDGRCRVRRQRGLPACFPGAEPATCWFSIVRVTGCKKEKKVVFAGTFVPRRLVDWAARESGQADRYAAVWEWWSPIHTIRVARTIDAVAGPSNRR